MPLDTLAFDASKYEGQVPEKVDGVEVLVLKEQTVLFEFAIGAACFTCGACLGSESATASKIVSGFTLAVEARAR